jgi:hypothetical protein
MIVLRADSHGNFKNSRPCAHCIETLQKYGIQKVIYSNEEGGFTEEHVMQMDKDKAFITLGWKRIQKVIPWNKKYS